MEYFGIIIGLIGVFIVTLSICYGAFLVHPVLGALVFGFELIIVGNILARL